MSNVKPVPAGGYRFIEGVFQYSAGVASEPGFIIECARFRKVKPIREAFAAVEKHLAGKGRPLAAFCACELRSPAPFMETGFAAFNKVYVGQLERWGILLNGVNPIARTNVCPKVSPPDTVGMHAFAYTMPAPSLGATTFVVAGSGEAPEGKGTYRDHAIRLGDRSPEGLREKAQWVLGEMERRMAALGVGWAEATSTQLYTIYDIYPFLEAELAARGAMAAGLNWHFARPPVKDLDYEMDVRGVYQEIMLDTAVG
jgi:hypothetical protein